jgi:AcrR family transcriptional regulator
MDKYHHGNLRSALLKAAFHLAARAENFTLREVARRAGVSHNAPYRHFRSKEDLIAALATDSFRQLLAYLRAAVAEVPSPPDRLQAAARAYLRFALKNPSRFNIMFHSTFDREAYPDYVAAYTESLSLVSELLEPHKDLNVDADTAAELVWASVHGITGLGLAGRLRKGHAANLEHLADEAVRVLLGGMHRTDPSA